MVFAERISGKDGKITIPSIGALIGYTNQWHLVKSADGKSYNLSAGLGYINPKAWAMTQSGEYTRQIVLQVGKDTFYRLEQADGAKVELNDQTLTMEQVTLHPH